MTRIERLVVHRVTIPLLRPFVTAVRRTERLDAVLIEAIDSDGRSGWGEAVASWRVTGESADSISAVVSGPLSDAVIGQSVGDLDELGARVSAAVVHNASARSAVDCALHDLAAQERQKSLRSLLNADAQPVTTDMTLSVAPVDELVAAAVAQVAAGFSTLKVKVGARRDDADALARVREAVGPSIRLRVDANQGWSAAEAIRIIRQWEDSALELEFVEQPVSAHDLDALAEVTRSVATPIVADESMWTRRELGLIVERRAADLVNIKLAKAGGLTEGKRLVEDATASEMGVLVGCMMESQVGIAAAEALAATLCPQDAGRAQDLDAGLWLGSSPVAGGITYAGPRLVSSNQAGLGIDGLASGRNHD